MCSDCVDNANVDISSVFPSKSNSQFLQASSFKPQIELDFQSSSEDMDLGSGGDEQQPKAPQAHGANEGNPGGSDDDHDANYLDDDENSAGEFNSDIVSFDENIVDAFALIETRDQIFKVESQVENVNGQVGALDSKLDQVLKSISEIKTVTHSIKEREQQLDELISILKHTMEESEQHYT